MQFDHLFVGEMRPIVDEGVRVVRVAMGTYRRLGDFAAEEGGREGWGMMSDWMIGMGAGR